MGIGQKILRRSYEDSLQSHGGTKNNSQAYGELHHGHQMARKVPTRAPVKKEDSTT
jgi:hypothetical protein